MMKKFYLVIIATLFTQGLIAQEIHYADNVPVEEIRLPIQHAIGGYVDEIYDEIEYIPLETSKESMIQKIDRLWVTDQYFIVLDRIGGQFVFFDKNGKYIRKITNEVPNCENCKSLKNLFHDATIDLENEYIYAQTYIPVESYYRLKYDFNGNYLGVQPQFNDMNDFSFWKGSLFYYNSPRGLQEERNFNMLSILHDNKEKTIITYDSLTSVFEEAYNDINRSFSISSNKDSFLYFNRPYDYSIYELDAEGLNKIYKFVFPLEYSIPSDFITNKEYDDKREKMIKEEKPKGIMLIDFIRRHKNYLIFTTRSYDTSQPSQFAYNLSTGTLIDFEKVTPNDFNNNFSLGNDLNEYILASDDQYMYKSIMPSNLSTPTKESTFKYTNDPDGKVRKMIGGLTNFSNPILVRLKVKSDI